MSEPSLTLRSGSMVDERTYDARERFAALFDVLVTLKDQCQAGDRALHSESDTELASVIQASVGSYAGELSALPRHSHYSRHVIGIQGDWIGYICRWEPNSASCVHGHPSFAFYQVIQGAFAMDLYKATSTTRAQMAIPCTCFPTIRPEAFIFKRAPVLVGLGWLAWVRWQLLVHG